MKRAKVYKLDLFSRSSSFFFFFSFFFLVSQTKTGVSKVVLKVGKQYIIIIISGERDIHGS